MKAALWIVPAVAAVAVVAVVGLSRVPFERIGWQQSPQPTPTPRPAPVPQPPSRPAVSLNDNVLIGWNKTRKPGVFVKWCTGKNECDGASEKDFTGNGYTAMLVWCKDAPCGSIYAEVNLIGENDLVVGWTNDTGFGAEGDKVMLVFRGQENSSASRLTKLLFL
jgi:hypothetical protein